MKINGMTMAGFVFALVALFVGGAFGMMASMVGATLSIVGYAMIRMGNSEGRRLAIASFIMPGLELIWFLANW